MDQNLQTAIRETRRCAYQLGILLGIELNRLALLVIGGERAAGHLPSPETVDTFARRALDILGFPADKRQSFEETLRFGRSMAPTIRELPDGNQRRSEMAGAAHFMTLSGSLVKADLAERYGPEVPHFMLLGETTVKILSQIKAWESLIERSRGVHLAEFFEQFQRDIVRARKGIGEDDTLPVFLLEVEQTRLESEEDLRSLQENFTIVCRTYFPDFDPECFNRMALF